MNSTIQMEQLLDFTRVVAAECTPAVILETALPVLATIAEAEAALVLVQTPEGLRVTTRAGIDLDGAAGEDSQAAVEPGLISCPVPPAWAADGIGRVASQRLPARAGILVLAWEREHPVSPALEVALATLDASLTRAQSEEKVADLVRRVDSAQQLANVAQLRRRQALEVNDNVVQGLVAAVYSLDVGEVDGTMSYLDGTLSAARAMMDDLLDPLDGVELQPGDLVRAAPAVLGTGPGHEDVVHGKGLQRSHSVLLVDDTEDLRMLLRLRMENREGLTVVGEAADGVEAVERATELQPDLVVLDLGMPRMDGLEALPLIRAAVPGVRVIVLSGFNESTMAQKSLEAGADHYVVKGGSMDGLLELVDGLLEPSS